MLAEADASLTRMAFGQTDPNDDKLFVKFELYPHPDPDATAKEGRPMFKETEYITIIVPGDRINEIHRPVWDKDRIRFPRQYAAFKNGMSQAQSGTPLSEWSVITRSQVRELEYFHVTTVEQVADLADNLAQKFPGIQRLKKLAQDWLAQAKDASHVTKLRSELDNLSNALEVANRNNAALAARLELLEEQAQTKKAGK